MKIILHKKVLALAAILLIGFGFSSCQKEEPAMPVILSTLEATEITAKSAWSGVSISDNGGGTIIASGIVWGFEPNPGVDQNQGSNTNNSGAEVYIISLFNLLPETRYYVRAFAINSAGTFYGNEITFETIEGVTDIDGNVYNTIAIGNQVWMAENLKTTKYSNGDLIGTTQPVSFNITEVDTPKFQWPAGGNESNVPLFGRLYTWHVVNDSRNVCPAGWHVPTEAEWTTLENHLITNGFNYDNTGAGNKIAKSLAAASGWNSSSTVGAVGNTDYPEKRNASGFSALPAGMRYSSGNFDYMGTFVYWRSAGDVDENSAWSHFLFNDSGSSQRIVFGKRAGFSVRCVKD